MSYIAERRGEEKERRRAEILDAAKALYAKQGWDALTVDQVARSARLSRALVYVYFRDKEELLFAIGERAMQMLRDRLVAAATGHAHGLDKVTAIGQAYMTYAHEFPHYFDFCSRFHAHSVAIDPGSHEGACQAMGDALILAATPVWVQSPEPGSVEEAVDSLVADALAANLELDGARAVDAVAAAAGERLARAAFLYAAGAACDTGDVQAAAAAGGGSDRARHHDAVSNSACCFVKTALSAGGMQRKGSHCSGKTSRGP
jgi:AcrR family transcriptional regulator